MKRANSFVLVTLLFFSSLLIFTSPSRAASTPTIYVDPPHTTIYVNETSVSINVSITQATNVSGWEFSLYYINSILHIMTATEGNFLKKGGATTWFWPEELNDNYNSTHGRVSLTCIQLGDITNGVDGSGSLATITFTPFGGGNSTMHLSDLVLVDPAGNKFNPINSSDGSVQVIGIADIAVTIVAPSKTVVCQGYSMNITVTVANQGDQTTNFNITGYANTTAIQTQTLNLTGKTSANVTLILNTTAFAKGNYITSAYAWPVPGETNMANNNCTGGTIKVSMVGDVNGDGKVNLIDVFAVALAYGSYPGHPTWNPNYDINNDGKINLIDYFTTVLNYGKTDP
jgi:hypothetical protein